MRNDLHKGIMILPSSHSSHNGGGCMRTMRRLESYEDSANYGLKYSQLSGVSGTNTIKDHRLIGGKFLLIYNYGLNILAVISAHCYKCADFSLLRLHKTEVCTFDKKQKEKQNG